MSIRHTFQGNNRENGRNWETQTECWTYSVKALTSETGHFFEMYVRQAGMERYKQAGEAEIKGNEIVVQGIVVLYSPEVSRLHSSILFFSDGLNSASSSSFAVGSIHQS